MEIRKKFENEYTPEEVNSLLRDMNTYPKHSKEYLLIRNCIFEIYYKYPEHIIDRYINKMDISYEDLLNDIYIFLLECIESYNFSEYFTTYINKHISYKIIEKYRLNGVSINKFKSYVNDTNDLEYYLKKEPYDVYDMNIEDRHTYIDKYLESLEKKDLKNLILDLVFNLDKLPSIQKRLQKNIDNYKRLLIVRYGLLNNEKITLKETASIFGEKEKWVKDNLSIALRYLREAIMLYNEKVSEDEKIYIK